MQSASDEPGQVQEAMNAGAYDYLVKPLFGPSLCQMQCAAPSSIPAPRPFLGPTERPGETACEIRSVDTCHQRQSLWRGAGLESFLPGVAILNVTV